MYIKANKMWQSYGCPHGHNGGFFVLHLAISIIGTIVGVVCCVLFSIHENREPEYAVLAAVSALLAGALVFTHIAVRYIPNLAPPELLQKIAITGLVGAAVGICGIFYNLGRALFMTALVRSKVVLTAWSMVVFTWGAALTTFARYYQGQSEECRPIMQQRKQPHDDDEIICNVV
ncbi:unnamed protein product [Meganyctiphanes norvegica]|uniref:Uncharacterized protein n=1 Tax=Meganyctiphanes norvegica TaxID=48144 RepID=A0AAV2SI14_MEGNR